MFRNVGEPKLAPPPTIWSTFYFRASISMKINFPCWLFPGWSWKLFSCVFLKVGIFPGDFISYFEKVIFWRFLGLITRSGTEITYVGLIMG